MLQKRKGWRLNNENPFRDDAEQIFMLAANRIEDMYITVSSATDIYYLVKKHLHSTEQAKSVMSKLYELFYVLGVTASDCKEALLSEINDYEDAVISCCAAHNRMDYIVTRNIKDYEKSKIQAIPPEVFLSIITQEEE